LHYEVDHPGIAPAAALDGQVLGLSELEELDRRDRYARERTERAIAHGAGACFICGEAPSSRYAISIGGIVGATPAADLCTLHGVLWIHRIGRLLGELKEEHEKRKEGL
jgi:hypothetical protein